MPRACRSRNSRRQRRVGRATDLRDRTAFWRARECPRQPQRLTITQRLSWSYALLLNILFLALAAVLTFCLLRNGGPEVLRMMARAKTRWSE